MATDLFLDPLTHDLYLDPESGEIRLTESLQELVRQRISIRLQMFRGEWYANTQLGLPYFQSIYGKGTKAATDLAIRQEILAVEGVVRILTYESEINTQTRELKVNFSCLSESGEIITVEETVNGTT